MNLKSLKDNKKGVTLVEIIIGVLLLAIASIILVRGFVATANIINRATLYKNASAASSSTIELQEIQPSVDANVQVDFSRDDGTLTIKGKKSNGSPISTTVNGEYISSADNGKSSLVYREFLPGSYDFNVPAVETGG